MRFLTLQTNSWSSSISPNSGTVAAVVAVGAVAAAAAAAAVGAAAVSGAAAAAGPGGAAPVVEVPPSMVR